MDVPKGDGVDPKVGVEAVVEPKGDAAAVVEAAGGGMKGEEVARVEEVKAGADAAAAEAPKGKGEVAGADEAKQLVESAVEGAKLEVELEAEAEDKGVGNEKRLGVVVVGVGVAVAPNAKGAGVVEEVEAEEEKGVVEVDGRGKVKAGAGSGFSSAFLAKGLAVPNDTWGGGAEREPNKLGRVVVVVVVEEELDELEDEDEVAPNAANGEAPNEGDVEEAVKPSVGVVVVVAAGEEEEVEAGDEADVTDGRAVVVDKEGEDDAGVGGDNVTGEVVETTGDVVVAPNTGVLPKEIEGVEVKLSVVEPKEGAEDPNPKPALELVLVPNVVGDLVGEVVVLGVSSVVVDFTPKKEVEVDENAVSGILANAIGSADAVGHEIAPSDSFFSGLSAS